MSTSEVFVLDLRDGADQPPPSPSGGVVVLDRADTLVEHAEVYLGLLSEEMVTAVVCVAVGEPAPDDGPGGVALTAPSVLRNAAVLWVGDERGVDWAPGDAAPRPPERPGAALEDLVAALRVPELFDRVVELAEGRSVSPGVRLVSCAVDPAEEAAARAAAVRSLCADDQPVGEDFGAALVEAHVSSTRDGAVLAGRVHAVQLDVVRRLNHVTELARALGTPAALFGTRRPTEEIGKHVLWAGQAVENYRQVVVELLDRVDGHVQIGRPPMEDVLAMGVSPPVEAAGDQVAADLRRAVDAQLDAGAALPALAHELRLLSARTGPQGCTAALEAARLRGPLSLEMPEFPRWPLSLWTLPLVLSCCAVVAYLLGPGWAGWVGGALLAACWSGAGWLVLARRPRAEGEAGAVAAAPVALATFGAAAAVGVVGGALGALAQPSPFTSGWQVQAGVWSAALLSAAVVVLGWRSAVHQWRARLRLAAMHDAVVELTGLAEDAVAGQWRPLRRRRAIAAAADEVAAGLEEVATALRGAQEHFCAVPRGTTVDGHDRMMRPVPAELYAVVRGDVVEVCRCALEPAWPAATSALRTAPGVYEQRLNRLIDEYTGDIRRHGLFAAARADRDEAARDALMARVWAETPAAAQALRVGAGGEMTQLCRSGQLRYLSTSAEPGLLRFAPARLRRVVRDGGAHQGFAADLAVTWGAGGELIGALRLLPLRVESVRHDAGGGE
ncbi:hypothetical protein JOF41_001201 [Saccharothrix coeruleofusca]|uniref:hypothetical protein n=1 Tax=Saccharothrix coeruleofusca TaxID=33919 RepID=UPI001AE6AFE8|nr:hypothetical protein [Saccharothrix coeruleofusca]MBP2335023.1 hypothetical protein [Saccharothrix coeruleofusca]